MLVVACSIDEQGLLAQDPGQGGAASGGASVGGSGNGGTALTGGGAGSGGGVGGSSGTGGDATGGSGGTGGSGATGGSSGTGGSPSGGANGCPLGEQCVPKVASGWSYAFLGKAAYSPTAPAGAACHDGSTPDRFYIDPVGAAQCAACNCGTLQNGACSVPLLCATNKTCQGATDWSQGDGSCQGKSGSPDLSCKLGPAIFSAPGACPPGGGQLLTADPWKQVADLCVAKASVTCASNSECVPTPTGAYAGSVCVYLPGDQACPTDYSTKALIFKKSMDTRACSACSCGSGSPACAGAEYKFYDDGLCAGSSQTVNSTACVDLTDHINNFWVGWGYRRSGTGSVTGTCPPSGGQPSGSLTGDPAASLSVCCRPGA